MQLIIYDNLTNEQKEFLTNGCGGKNSIIPVPEFIFHEDCDRHDVAHYIGFTESDRVLSNKIFYSNMKSSISEVRLWKRLYYRMWAFAYYQVVKRASKSFFNYSDSPKYMHDLRADMLFDTRKTTVN